MPGSTQTQSTLASADALSQHRQAGSSYTEESSGIGAPAEHIQAAEHIQNQIITAFKMGNSRAAAELVNTQIQQNPQLLCVTINGQSIIDRLFAGFKADSPNMQLCVHTFGKLFEIGVRVQSNILINMFIRDFVDETLFVAATVPANRVESILFYNGHPQVHFLVQLLAHDRADVLYPCFALFPRIINDLNNTTPEQRTYAPEVYRLFAETRDEGLNNQAALIYAITKSAALPAADWLLQDAISAADAESLCSNIRYDQGNSFPAMILHYYSENTERCFDTLGIYFACLEDFTTPATALSEAQKADIKLRAVILGDFKILSLIVQHLGLEPNFLLDEALPYSEQQTEELIKLNLAFKYPGLSDAQYAPMLDQELTIFYKKRAYCAYVAELLAVVQQYDQAVHSLLTHRSSQQAWIPLQIYHMLISGNLQAEQLCEAAVDYAGNQCANATYTIYYLSGRQAQLQEQIADLEREIEANLNHQL